MASNTQAVKWTTPTTIDILKTLKGKFLGSELEPYDKTKVWLRENGRVVVEKPEDLWRDHFRRRRANTDLGFFSTSWEPFRCLGGPLTLDVNDLLYQTYSSYLEPTKPDVKSDLPEVIITDVTQSHREDSTEYLPPPAISVRLNTSGYKNIKDLLKIQRERKMALKGGMPYMDHLRKIDKRLDAKKKKPVNGMVLMSTSDFAFLFAGAIESVTTSVESKVSSDESQAKDNLSEGKSNNSSTKSSPRSKNSAVSLLQVSSDLTERFERLRRDNLEFLNTLYRIITIMRNLKCVDLKSRHPLTRHQLKDLETSRRVDREHTRAGGVTQLQKRLSADTAFSMDLSPTYISYIPSPIESRRPSVSGVMKRKNRLLSMFSSRPSAIGNEKTSRGETSMRDYRIETWDDLLTAGDKTEEPHDLPAQVIPSTMLTRSLRCSRRSLAVKDVHTSIDDKHPKPVWQHVANERPPSPFGDSKTNSKYDDPLAIVQRARSNMEKVNKSIRESSKDETNKINRNRIASFRYKFDTLREIEGNTLYEKHMRRMREPKDFGIIDPDLPDNIPSKWLDELREKIYTIVGNEDTEANNALTKLRQHSQMEVKNIPQTKAKLCLIVMSLAAYDICKISTQLAIKFIMEKIIHVPVGDFHNWLSLRKLPVVIII